VNKRVAHLPLPLEVAHPLEATSLFGFVVVYAIETAP
jgi:hypothetical protein